uniref:Uncharacterized protein n=1 Tax=viral metagenome TaxID=1070528 RepID=A0A6M3IPE8_9ZZZZ
MGMGNLYQILTARQAVADAEKKLADECIESRIEHCWCVEINEDLVIAVEKARAKLAELEASENE